MQFFGRDANRVGDTTGQVCVGVGVGAREREQEREECVGVVRVI